METNEAGTVEILSRNEKGEITDGNITVTIPKDRSVFCILGSPRLIEDDAVFDDKASLIRYSDGRTRRWVQEVCVAENSRVRLYTAKATLERVYKLWVRLSKACDRRLKLWQDVIDIAKGKKDIYAKPTHKYKKCGNFTYWKYSFTETSNGGTGISFDWVAPPQMTLRVKEGLKLGQAIYVADRRASEIGSRRYVVERVLFWLLDKEIRKILDQQENISGSRVFIPVYVGEHIFYAQAIFKGPKWYSLKIEDSGESLVVKLLDK